MPLRRDNARVVCSRGHSFDIARSGYINLLQPQDRRSKNPGDTIAAVRARRRLHDLSVTAPLYGVMAEMLEPSATDVVLDAGCGEGFYLGTLVSETGCAGHGVDISIPAIDAAARRYPDCQWIVANADRFLPYRDASFSILLSITGRTNPDEFRRTLRDNGRLLVAIPSPEDLVELRGPGRDLAPRTRETFSHTFRLLDQRRATTTADLDAATVEEVLLSIYRPLRSEPVRAMRLTFSFDFMLFQLL